MGERQAMEEDSAEDKRQFDRKDHREPVQFHQADHDESESGSVAKNLSPGGIQIRLNDFVPLGTELTLTIHLADEKIIECVGRVVRIERARYGEYYMAGLEFAEDDSVAMNQKKIFGFLSHP